MFGWHSVRHRGDLRSLCYMEECNVMKCWDEKCKNECESVRVCEQRREVCRGIGVT